MPLPEEAFAHRVKSQSMKIPQINGKTISRNKSFLEMPPPTSCKMESLRKYIRSKKGHYRRILWWLFSKLYFNIVHISYILLLVLFYSLYFILHGIFGIQVAWNNCFFFLKNPMHVSSLQNHGQPLDGKRGQKNSLLLPSSGCSYFFGSNAIVLGK